MPTLKARCPECNAAIRQPIDAIDEPTEIELTCPKCGHEFTATAEPEVAPKPARRRDDDRPKRKAAAKSNNTLVIAGVVAGALLIGGVAVAVMALGGPKDKDTAKKDDSKPAKPEPRPKPEPGPKPEPEPEPNPNPLPNPVPNPGPNPEPNPPPEPNPQPKPKDPEEDLSRFLPPPPKIRINGSAVPPAAPLAKPPVSPPLAPEDDPFERAKTFRADGPPPKPPALPPVAERPVLVLDARGHSGMIRGMFLTPDGAKVVTVSEDKSVRVWDMATGEVLHTVRFPGTPGPVGTLYAAALSPNGNRLAVGGIPLGDGKDGVPVYLVSVDTGRLEKAVFGVRQTPFALEFTPDGNRLVVGCVEGTVQTFDVASGKAVGESKPHAGNVRQIRFSAKGNRMATLAADKVVRIWDTTKAGKDVVIPLPEFGPAAIGWSPDGQTLAVGGTSGAILLVGPDGKEQKTIPGIAERGTTVQVLRLTFTPDGKDIVWGGIALRGHAGVIEAATGNRRVAVPFHNNTVGAVHVSRDGTLAASMGGDNADVFVWRVADGSLVRRFVGSGQAVYGVRWAADGKSVAFGNVNTMDADGVHGVQHTFRLDEFGLGGPPEAAKYLRPRYAAGDVRLVWKNRGGFDVLQNGQLLKGFTMPDGVLLDALSLVPGRGLLISAGHNLDLIDPRTGKGLRRYSGHTGPVLGIAVSPDDRHFVTGSVDQTIRLWAVDREEPLLNLFVVGREWIAWTPEGYYASSAYGEQLIAWQVNQGVAKLPTAFPAARFRASMYQPALLKYLIPAGEVPRAMAMAQKFDAALVKAGSVADVLPPEVTLVAPAGDDAVVDQEKITVKATAKGNAKQPVVALRLLVDGRPFGGSAGVRRFDKPGASAEATWEVPLTPGPHWVAVIAESPVSKGMSRVVSVTRPGEPPKPNLYLVAVGVSDYPGDEMDLKYAASDARLLADTFQKRGKGVFADVEVRVVTDADATKERIRKELDWLKSKMTAKDVGIVAFSGHGTRDRKGRFHLVPADVSEADPEGTCLSGDEFKSRLENMPGRLVAILDACHSGAVAEKSRPPARADGLVRDLVAEDAGVVVMCASLGREYALESPMTKAGFFTLGLVEGMAGHGDVDQDGVVYIHELDLYASVRVSQLSGGTQNPTTGRPPTIRPFPIAKP